MKTVVIELVKWGLVLFLLYPLFFAMNGPVDFARVVVGETFLIVFIGKLFYDTIIFKFTRSSRTASQDLLSVLGLIAAIGVVLISFLLLIGFTLTKFFHDQNPFIF